MTFDVVDAEQRSPEWHAARLGRLTGSRAGDMAARRKDGSPAAGRTNLCVQLALERVVGRPLERDFVSAAMQQGIDREPDALMLYEVLTGRVLDTTGFLSCRELQAGCSLDGFVGSLDGYPLEGIVEAKSPIPATHWQYLVTGEVPRDYLLQATHNLWVTGARWCDWISYNPDFPERLQSKLVRIHRRAEAIAAYDREAREFLLEVDAMVAQVREMADRG